ncbi:MAG: hypothetical protein AVDCRST_MAG49-2506 [uncultured Thermomicrobiales bacterium]|uniref:Uncharacterized protein n=1 Tax=uncultured Thermomicrobiales bacterium TaxID=1645740 RepID=A0A6J4UUM7_9BACT|nr:MAG: hypothetical protein AVDCRST_MAG49-2506 [uncultured Thermomicrobiales bacterium]
MGRGRRPAGMRPPRGGVCGRSRRGSRTTPVTPSVGTASDQRA